MNLRQHSQVEELELQKIELRRREHAERLKRIMDEKNVKMGMDFDFLQKQIEEKKEKERLEKEEEISYQKKFLEEQRLLAKLTAEEKKERKLIELETNEFRKNYQKNEDRREFDINRSDFKKTSSPARITDNDEWLSVSSGQKFEGEDLTSEERKKLQQEQLKKWYSQQIQEKKNKEALEIEQQKKWEQKYIQNDQITVEVGFKEKDVRSQLLWETAQYNKKLAFEKKIRESQQKELEIEMNIKEIETIKKSPFLQESRTQAIGNEGKLVTTEWKGFTDEEKNKNLKYRENQIAFEKSKKEEEIKRQALEEAERVKAAKEALKLERIEIRERKERERKNAEENLELSKQQKEFEKTRNKKIYGENRPNDDFWNYFGKSER